MTVESVLDQPLFGWNPIAGPGSTVTFDAENRVICLGSCTAPGVWTYTYDGDGKRVKKSNGSTGTLYWTGMGSDALSESDLSGNINEEYFYFSGQRVARADRPSNVVHYYVNDRLGTASIIATPSGYNSATVAESDYSPYGIEIPIAGGDSNHYKFTGKERDTESSLDNFGARYYASPLGRFMTPDWSEEPEPAPYSDLRDPQSLNLYSYLRNNPMSSMDDDGHECTTDPNTGNVKCVVLQKAPDPPNMLLAAAATIPFDIEGGPPGWLVASTIAVFCAATPSCRQPIINLLKQDANSSNTTDTSKSDEKTAEDGSKSDEQVTPTTKPEQFEPVKNTSGKRDKTTGEIWQKDKLHKDHYEVYKNRKDYDNGRRDRSVWEDGRLKEKF